MIDENFQKIVSEIKAEYPFLYKSHKEKIMELI